MLETILKRLKQDRHGVSNVIVVMLSLVLIVVIVANVVLWSYQMNQLDWERMSEEVKITNVTRVAGSSWFVAQNEYTVNMGSRIGGTYSDTQTIDDNYETFREPFPYSLHYPYGCILGGSTSNVSGSVSDLTLDDGVYMSFRSYTYYDYDYHYAESDSESSTTQTTWQDKVTLTFTSAADAYLVIASAELRGSSSSYDMEARLTVDATTYAELDTRPDETATDLYSHHFATFKTINLTAASHTFKLQYRSSSFFGTCSIRHARIAVFRIFDYALAENESEQSVSGWYSDKVSKTFNVETAGEYLIIASAELNPSSTYYSILARTEIDSAYQDEVSLEAEDITSSWECYFTHDIRSFGASSHTVSIQASSESWTHYIRRARIIVVRLTDYFLGWESGKSNSYTTNGATSWADKLVVTFTPSTQSEYLILASAIVGGDATNGEDYHSSFDFTLDGTEEGLWHGGISDNTDRITYATLKNSTLSETSHSLKLRYHSEIWTSPEAGMGSARIVAIPMCGWKVVEVEFTGSSNTDAWTTLEWTIDSAWTTDSVNVTLQLYNYSLGNYPTSGNGYMSYESSATADTDETKSQNITVNPTHFRNATGYWKMRVKGIKATETQFDFKADMIELKPTSSSRLDINGTFVIDVSMYSPAYIQTVEIQMKYRANDTGEKWYLKAYNWTATAYSDNGFNSTSGHTPTTEWDYYAVNLADQWGSYVHNNGTVYLKVVDEGADNNQTTIDIDFLGVRVAINGTRFTFQNRGSSTSHLVSLWVNNSTDHQRYSINVFINSGDIVLYTRNDIILPNEPYTVKVVTERGNRAVFTSQ